MRIFKFWTRVERTLTVAGQARVVHCFGGSNLSDLDAVRDAERRLEHAARRIAGRRLREEAYEADIREEVLERIDERNVITRNRYGAEVLNSADLMFIDIDEPRYGFLDLFRARPAGEAKKARIVEQVKKFAAKSPDLRGLGVRLYETHNGIRAIVTGRHYDPKLKTTQKLLRLFNADPLYSHLCRRQGCFRARLTPKPFRMKCRTHKVAFPRPDPAQEAEHLAWVSEYDGQRRKFCTCRLLFSLGHDVREAAVTWHDKETGALSGLTLA